MASTTPTTKLRSRRTSLPSTGASLPSVRPDSEQQNKAASSEREVAQQKVSRSFKKKLSSAARKLKSKTYGDLKRWVLGQKLKPLPQSLLGRISYDPKMQGALTQRNSMLSTLADLKEKVRELKQELLDHDKGSARYQEIQTLLKSIPVDREALKQDILDFNKEIEKDLPRFAEAERQHKKIK
ncbi:hypothetical protein EOPP23_09315 [Endozoicomonas sp. OPT23]|nr:hypothetical protein [Endozoicomonas sp. OPT23]